MIYYVQGDLFQNQYKVDSYAHGVNCQGFMGAGIAKEFRARYNQMYLEYKKMCLSIPRELNTGEIYYWKSNDKPSVYNLATQDKTGRQAKLTHVEQCFVKMKEHADKNNVTSIAMPAIGSGIGGLRIESVKQVLEIIFSDWSGEIYFFDRFSK